MTVPSAFNQMYQAAGKQEMISHDLERHLIRRYKKKQCNASLRKLISSYLRLIVGIAGNSKYAKTEDQRADNIQNAIFGFAKAIEKFHLSNSNRLSSFSRKYIAEAIMNGRREDLFMVQRPKTKEFRDVWSFATKEMSKLEQSQPYLHDAEKVRIVSERINIDEGLVYMSTLGGNRDYSLNVKQSKTGTDGDGQDWIDVIEDSNSFTEAILANSSELEFKSVKLREAFSVLNDRERDVLERRRLQENPDTLSEIAKDYSVSYEAIRQIENKAFDKVQKRMRNLVHG